MELLYHRPWLNGIRLRLHSSYFLPLLILLICCSAVCTLVPSYYKMFECKTTDGLYGWTTHGSHPRDPLNKTIFSLYGLHLMGQEQQVFLNTMNNIDDSTSCQTDDSLNVVLVIGESYIKSHAQLYGYQLQTTPYLIQEQDSGRLFRFDDVVSPTPSTSLTIKNVLCTNSMSHHEAWAYSPFFPTLFRRAGYHVYLWDNQKNYDQHAMFSFALNSFLYCKEVTDMTYTQTNDSSYTYDADIVSSFNKVLLTGPRNLVIFHLIGQHVEPQNDTQKKHRSNTSPLTALTGTSLG